MQGLGAEVVERLPVVGHQLTIEPQHAQARLCIDVANAVHRCVAGQSGGQHIGMACGGCGKAQLVIIAARQRAQLLEFGI